MKLLPIVEGCDAWIINSSLNRGSVKVGKCLGKSSLVNFNKINWEVDREMNTSTGKTVSFLAEHQLMRIDGYEESESSETKQKELVK